MPSRVQDDIVSQIKEIIKQEYDVEADIVWSKPPSADLGDISFPLFNISKLLEKTPEDLSKVIIKNFDLEELVEKVEFQGGFLNLFFKKNNFVEKTLQHIIAQTIYGQSSEKSSERIIVEHTSSNPTGPLHIGNVRGSILGDVLGRLYKFLGAAVNVRYYVNDLGRQIAPIIIGYDLLKEEKIDSDIKIDLWIGKIYAVMNTLLEINQFKNRLLYFNLEIYPHSSIYELKDEEISKYLLAIENSVITDEDKLAMKDRLKKISQVKESLHAKLPDMYDKLESLVSQKIENLEKMTTDYVKKYQEGLDSEIVDKFREVTKKALSGHVDTLNIFNIFHDDFDWESDVAWSGEVEKVLRQLDDNGFIRHDGLAKLLMNDKIASKTKYKEKYNIKYEIPDLIVVNSEGITLYTSRDIAYHLDKLEKFNATHCYNVIAKMQQLPQLSVRLALYGVGKSEDADRITHFDYEYVSLIGRKMSGREFEYVTLDELYDLVKVEVDKLVENRDYSEDEKIEIARKVAASSVKYHILKMDPQKAVAFDVKKAVDLNENSGPFLQYSYARALNILKKAPEKNIDVQTVLANIKDIDFAIKKREEWELVKLMEELPSIYLRAVESMRPDTVANFAHTLASSFHKFYEVCPVLAADDENILKTRLILVYSVVKCLESIFEVIGIDALEKM